MWLTANLKILHRSKVNQEVNSLMMKKKKVILRNEYFKINFVNVHNSEANINQITFTLKYSGYILGNNYFSGYLVSGPPSYIGFENVLSCICK